jgi:hypothetical protein
MTLKEAFDKWTEAQRTIFTLPVGPNLAGIELRREQAKRAMPKIREDYAKALGAEADLHLVVHRPDQREALEALLLEALDGIDSAIVFSADLLYKQYADGIAGMRTGGFGMVQWSALVGMMRDTAVTFGLVDVTPPKAQMSSLKPTELPGFIRDLVRKSNGDDLAAAFLRSKLLDRALKADVQASVPIIIMDLQTDNVDQFRSKFLGAGTVVDVTALLDNKDAVSEDLEAVLGKRSIVVEKEETPKRKSNRKAPTV